MNKLILLENLHKIFRSDNYIDNLMEASGKELDNAESKIEQLGKEFFFDTMSSVGIAVLESQLDFKATGDSIEGKREELEARWKTAGKCDLELLKGIANSWRNGEASVLFTNAVIEITFSIIVIPNNVEALKRSLEEAKPAHLPINFTFKFNSNTDIKVNNGLSFASKQTINLLDMPGNFLLVNDEYGLVRSAITYSEKNKFIKIVPEAIYRIIDPLGAVSLEKTNSAGIPENGILKKKRGRLDFIDTVSLPITIEIIK